MDNEERFPDGVDCFDCHQPLSLGEGLEWPENPEEILCTWCEKELLAKLREDNKVLRKWVDDLQSGMFINCVYCGFSYGANTESALPAAEILKQHVENCPKHPMFKLKKKYDALANLSLAGVQRLKEENQTLQNAQQRTKYTLNKTRRNAAKLHNMIIKFRRRVLNG